jgi:hypothetical protein
MGNKTNRARNRAELQRGEEITKERFAWSKNDVKITKREEAQNELKNHRKPQRGNQARNE